MRIRNNVVAVFALALLVLPGISFGQSTIDLQAQIQSLLTQIQVLEGQLQAQGGNTAWCYTFDTNLSIGMTGLGVTALQTALQKDGESVTVNGTFDDQTASAVTGFQEKYGSQILAPNGLQYGTGYAGPSTRAKLNSLYACGTTTMPPITLTPATTQVPTSQSPVTILSPTGGETLVQGENDQISWSGGTTSIEVGLVSSNFNPNNPNILGYISLNASPNSSASWDAMSVTDLTGTVTFPVGPGSYKLLLISANANGTYCANSGCNIALSNVPFNIVSQAASPASSELFTATPLSLIFAATQGGSGPVNQMLSVGAASNIPWSISVSSGSPWLTTSPMGNGIQYNNGQYIGSSQFAIIVNTSNLSVGTYSGTITISGSFSNSPVIVPVTLTVTASGSSSGALNVTPTSLNFSGGQNGMILGQSLTFSNPNGAAMKWSATTPVWLSLQDSLQNKVTGASVSAGASVKYVVLPSTIGLAPGTYTGAITISENFSNTTVTIPVTLTITPAIAASPTVTSFSVSSAVVPLGGPLDTLSWATQGADSVGLSISCATGMTIQSVQSGVVTNFACGQYDDIPETLGSLSFQFEGSLSSAASVIAILAPISDGVAYTNDLRSVGLTVTPASSTPSVKPQ